MLDYQTAHFVASYGTSSQLPPSSKPEVSFVGRSNVGKSSIMNKVFGRKNLVKVSQTPGKTTAVNFFAVSAKTGGAEAHFVDLPGYGYAKVAKSDKGRWSELIEGYFTQSRRFVLVCVLVDIRHDVSELDLWMVNYLATKGIPYLIAFTKADKLSKAQRMRQVPKLCQQLAASGDAVVLETSSADGTGINDLRALIEDAMEQERSAVPQA